MWKGYQQNATIVRIYNNRKIQFRIDRDRKLLVLRKLCRAWKTKDFARLWRCAGYRDADRRWTHIVQERHRVACRIYSDERARLEVVVERSWIDTYSYRRGYARKRVNDHNIILQAVGCYKNKVDGIEDNAAWQLNIANAASDSVREEVDYVDAARLRGSADSSKAVTVRICRDRHRTLIHLDAGSRG